MVVREKNLLNWNEKSLTRFSWANVTPEFRRITGLDYDERKLQNKLHHLRGHYFKWMKLQRQSGLGRDKSTGGVTAHPSFWEEGRQVPACTIPLLFPSFVYHLLASYNFTV